LCESESMDFTQENLILKSPRHNKLRCVVFEANKRIIYGYN